MNRFSSQIKLLFALQAIFCSVVNAQQKTPPGVTFYVAPNGSDANAGSESAPFATPQRARDAIRAVKQRGLGRPVTVYLRGGTYFLREPLVFAPQDSGTPDAPITYAAYAGEIPVLSGGTRIRSWKQSGKLWTARVPAGENGALRTFDQLWSANEGKNERRPRARTPNNGNFRVAGSEGKSGPTVRHTLPLLREFRFARGDLKSSWVQSGDAEAVVLHFWVETRLPIEEIDETTQTVRFARGSKLRLTDDNSQNGARYYVEGFREALDAPGEWFHDRARGEIAYFPKRGEERRNWEMIAPRLESLVRFEGRPGAEWVENLTLRGLTLSHNAWQLPRDAVIPKSQAAAYIPGAVVAVGARRCRLENVRLAHFGSYGIELGAGCTDNVIARCQIEDGGAGGIIIDGGDAQSPELLRTGRNTVEDNEIHHLGAVYPSAVGVLLMHTAGNRIAHNHIHHLFYSGVSVGWVWGYKPSVARDNLIEWNHIHDIGQGLLSDMGGIYLLGISPRTRVANNHIHDIQSHGYGGWGIYTDEGSSEITVENNLVYRTKSNPFNQHFGRANVVRNNIFALGGDYVVSQGRDDPPSFASDFNLLWDLGGELVAAGNPRGAKAVLSIEQWRALGQDKNSLVADPGFVNAANGDFTFKAASPALRLGFVPFAWREAGVRRGVVTGPARSSQAGTKRKEIR